MHCITCTPPVTEYLIDQQAEFGVQQTVTFQVKHSHLRVDASL